MCAVVVAVEVDVIEVGAVALGVMVALVVAGDRGRRPRSSLVVAAIAPVVAGTFTAEPESRTAKSLMSCPRKTMES